MLNHSKVQRMRKHLFFVLGLGLLLLTSLPAMATLDPEGEEFRLRLKDKLQDRQALHDLVEADPELSRRAFVIEALDLWNRRQNGSPPPWVSLLAERLAEEISQTHNDVKPLQIYDRFLHEKADVAAYELGRYAENIYPAYVGTPQLATLNPQGLVRGVHYGAGHQRRAEYDVAGFLVYYPTLLNDFRTRVAEAYLDPKLLIQEFELSSKATELSLQRLKELMPEEPTEKLEAQKPENDKWVKAISQALLVANGLYADLDAENVALFSAVEPEDKLAFLTIRFQAAYRTARRQEARSHLLEIESIVSRSSVQRPPLFLFLLKTMQFQARPDEETVSDQELLASFTSAWGELEPYEAGLKKSEDEDWWAARQAVRYWIDRLCNIAPEIADEHLHKIHLDLLDWLVESNNSKVSISNHYSSSEVWLQSGEVGASLTQQLSALDLDSYWLERLGMERGFDAEIIPEALDLLESITLNLGKTPDIYVLNPEDSPYPKLVVEDTSLMRELKFRLGYIRAVTDNKDHETQLVALLALVPNLEQLDRPESAIHYHQLLAREISGRGRIDVAIPLLEKSLGKAEKHGFRKKEIELASQLAELFAEQQDWQQAAHYSARANQVLQSTLSTTAPRDASQLARQGRNAGELQAVAHLKSDNPQAAFEALSKGKQLESAATQLAVNRNARGDLNAIASKQENIDVLQRQVQAVESLPESKTKAEVLETNRKQLAQTRSEFMLESRKIRAKYPKLYSTTLRFDPLVLPDVQGALPAEAAVVQYFLTDKEMFIFVVTQTDFRLHSVPVDQSELDGQVLAYLRTLRKASPNLPALTAQSQKLHALLIEPIRADIAQSSTLILIPSGRLNTLPFASLMTDSGEPLVERHHLVSLAKATDFMKIAGSQPKQVVGLVAFANATLDLPAAQKEGEEIKKIYPDSKLFVGGQANRDNLLKFAPGADILHLATHGLSDPVDSLNNYLALSENGKLTQEEIFNLELDETTLVTLSACNTALSDTTEYEFVASIAEAFWLAGARSVVASVWAVDDQSTELLMTEFYRGIKQDGLSKAEALQRAQLKVRANPRYAHPYYWAGFMLFGDYR